jgi:hypothetical protein
VTSNSKTKDTDSCRKCRLGRMRRGVALVQPFVPVGGGGRTLARKTTGPGKRIACMKCDHCGWSVT